MGEAEEEEDARKERGEEWEDGKGVTLEKCGRRRGGN